MSATDYSAYRQAARAFLAGREAEFGVQAQRGMNEPQRLALGRRWQRLKHDHHYAGIDWPTEYGGCGLSGIEKIIFQQEEMPYGFPTDYFGISLGMPVPIMLRRAAEPLRQRFAIPALRGEEIWCQLFSEPAAGSDLAGLRTTARPDDTGNWLLNGQKLWTSQAQHSDFGVIVARTDPTLPKHRGLTYFWLDMHAPGVTVRPVKLMTGESHVNEVFLDDVRIPDGQRLGAVGEGFAVAMETLFIERYAATDAAGYGPPAAYFAACARATMTGRGPAIEDGRIRKVLADAQRQQSALTAISETAFLAMAAGQAPDANGAIHKLVSMRARQRLAAAALDMMGPAGIANDADNLSRRNWMTGWLGAPLGRIAGGADEMLLNTIAERILGLPQDYRPDKNIPFNQIGS